MTKGTGRESDKFMLRLPDGMRDSLKAEAEKNKRSLNAEIVQRLEFTLGIDHSTPAPPSSDDAPSVDPSTRESILLDIKDELAALKAVLIETRRGPDGQDEYLIRKKTRKEKK